MRLLAALSLFPILFLQFVSAADEEPGRLTRSFTFQTPVGHGDAFRAGIKDYFACYRENEGARNWDAWVPASGDLNRFHFRTQDHHWADFDGDDATKRHRQSDHYDSISMPAR